MTAPTLADEIEALELAIGNLDNDLGPLSTKTIGHLRSAVARLEAVPPGRRCWHAVARWRHRKRGSSYEVLTSAAAAQCATGPINEGDHVTVYQADDESWWVRKTAEFQDGRFERIDALPSPARAAGR